MLLLESLAREVVARWERGDLAEAVRELDLHLQGIAEDRERHRDLIERAVGLYANDDIEIDADRTFIAASQEGAFVMGWLWVSRSDGVVASRPEEGAQSR
ncbi:hypothetical protein [Variovorax boronicumulans]